MKFHFQVRTDSHVMTTDMVELRDLNAARADAARRVGALLQKHSEAIWADEAWQMDVTNQRGWPYLVRHTHRRLKKPRDDRALAAGLTKLSQQRTRRKMIEELECADF